MPVKFPDILQHNNSSYPIVDAKDVKGIYVTSEPFGADALSSIPYEKRSLGTIASFFGDRSVRQYVGDAISTDKWTNITNWHTLSSGSIPENLIKVYPSLEPGFIFPTAWNEQSNADKFVAYDNFICSYVSDGTRYGAIDGVNVFGTANGGTSRYININSLTSHETGYLQFNDIDVADFNGITLATIHGPSNDKYIKMPEVLVPGNNLSDVNDKRIAMNNIARIENATIGQVLYYDGTDVTFKTIPDPITIKGRVDTFEALPTEGVENGYLYLVGVEGSEYFDEYVCVNSLASPIQWEYLGNTSKFPQPDNDTIVIDSNGCLSTADKYDGPQYIAGYCVKNEDNTYPASITLHINGTTSNGETLSGASDHIVVVNQTTGSWKFELPTSLTVTSLSDLIYTTDTSLENRYISKVSFSPNFDISNISSTGIEFMFYSKEISNSVNPAWGNLEDVSNPTYYYLSEHNLRKIEGLKYWDIKNSNITSLKYMFSNCYALEEIDIEDWDVTNIVNCLATFWRTWSLKLNISRWDLTSLENVRAMVQECNMVHNNFNYSIFKNSPLTDESSRVFCDNVSEYMNVSNIHLGNTTKVSSWFVGCKYLKTLVVNRALVIKSTSTSEPNRLFEYCENLQNIVSSDGTNILIQEGIDFTWAPLTLASVNFILDSLDNITSSSYYSNKIKFSKSSFDLINAEDSGDTIAKMHKKELLGWDFPVETVSKSKSIEFNVVDDELTVTINNQVKEIGAKQKQADWFEMDDTKEEFILNKTHYDVAIPEIQNFEISGNGIIDWIDGVEIPQDGLFTLVLHDGTILTGKYQGLSRTSNAIWFGECSAQLMHRIGALTATFSSNLSSDMFPAYLTGYHFKRLASKYINIDDDTIKMNVDTDDDYFYVNTNVIASRTELQSEISLVYDAINRLHTVARTGSYLELEYAPTISEKQDYNNICNKYYITFTDEYNQPSLSKLYTAHQTNGSNELNYLGVMLPTVSYDFTTLYIGDQSNSIGGKIVLGGNAGNGIFSITGTTQSHTSDVVNLVLPGVSGTIATVADIASSAATKQDILTSGDGITIYDNIISANPGTDWDENDPSSISYISNRTHYDEHEDIIQQNESPEIGNTMVIENGRSGPIHLDSTGFSENDYVKITINGVSYSGLLKQSSVNGITGGPLHIGNFALFGADYESTGENWCIMINGSSFIMFNNTGCDISFGHNDVKLYGVVPGKQLDSKYIKVDNNTLVIDLNDIISVNSNLYASASEFSSLSTYVNNLSYNDLHDIPLDPDGLEATASDIQDIINNSENSSNSDGNLLGTMI